MKSYREAVESVTARNELIGDIPSITRLNLTKAGIIDPLSGKNIEQVFSAQSEREARETRINLAMLSELGQKDGVGLWLSPPDWFYDRGKILLAIRSGNQIIEYDITGQTFSGNDFASFMTSLSAFHHDGYYFLPDREIVEAIIPMPKIWESIKTDQAEAKFNADVEEDMHYSNSRKVYLERDGVDIREACPTIREKTTILKTVSPDGKIRTFVHNCGLCHGEINGWMAPGDKCPHCKEEYLGVC